MYEYPDILDYCRWMELNGSAPQFDENDEYETCCDHAAEDYAAMCGE